MILHFCSACLCCAICCRHSGFRAVVCLAPWPPSSLPPWGKKATASGDSGHERPDDRTDGRRMNEEGGIRERRKDEKEPSSEEGGMGGCDDRRPSVRRSYCVHVHLCDAGTPNTQSRPTFVRGSGLATNFSYKIHITVPWLLVGLGDLSRKCCAWNKGWIGVSMRATLWPRVIRRRREASQGPPLRRSRPAFDPSFTGLG